MSCAASRGAEGSVKGAAFRVHRSAAETLDGFRPPLPQSRMKRGHLNEEEIRFSSEWTWGGALRGRNGPVGMGSERRWYYWAAVAREGAPSPQGTTLYLK